MSALLFKTPTSIFFTLLLFAMSACGDPDNLLSESTYESQIDSETERQEGNNGKFDSLEDQFNGQRPIKALYLTNYGNFWHNYEEQKSILMDGISRFVSIEFDLVGKDPEDSLSLMDIEDFGEPYDVIIYNMCFADQNNLQRINNIISQTRDLGVPAVLLHCSMHSFQQTSPHYPEQQLELRAAELDWYDLYPDTPFPFWWEFTGIDTLNHDWARSITINKLDNDQRMTRALPDQLSLRKDELYQNIKVKEGVVPLYAAHSVQSKKSHLVAWTHDIGNGRVFATTLGHDKNTMEHESYHRMLAYAIADLTNHIQETGTPTQSYSGTIRADNYQSTVICQPSDIVTAQNVEQVQDTVIRALEEERSLKVISLPTSNSNSEFICPEHGGILLNVHAMNQVIELDYEQQTVTVQPGIRAVELSEYLHSEGFAIPNMPDYTGVSIAGGISTSAHHSSLKHPSSMADMVVAMSIVDGQGRLRELQGEEIQSAAVHLGMLGVVVEVTLKIEPQFKLQYGYQKGSDEQLNQQIESMVREHDYARVMWFAGIGQYVLDYYDRVDTQLRGTSKHNVWTSTGSVFRFVGDLPYRVLNRSPLAVQCKSSRLRYNLWSPPLEVQSSNRNRPVGWSHEMLGSDCLSNTCPWDNDAVRSRTMEVSFPLSRVSDWMADVKGLLAQNNACFPILGLYLRFSKGSDRWLGFNYGQDTVSVEIHIPKVANETYQERSVPVYDEIMQMTLDRYAARPHWGKNSTPSFVNIGSDQYPKWSEFIELKRKMDPTGLFENRLWRLINQEDSIKHYPGCVLTRECICNQDSDCGHNYKCEQGTYYRQARVCREK